MKENRFMVYLSLRFCETEKRKTRNRCRQSGLHHSHIKQTLLPLLSFLPLPLLFPVINQ